VLATNQSGLGRGLFDMSALNAMHLKMNALLAKLGGRMDAIFFCPHVPDDDCSCRKPRPGLLQQIGERFGVQLSAVHMVGDSRRDLQAAAAAGCQPHLVLTGHGQAVFDQQAHQQVPGTQVHQDLAAFAQKLITQERLTRDTAGKHHSDFGRLDA
jgi:D-glycero-D-manno-heptose 1,7-bisphosphate phosphatase